MGMNWPTGLIIAYVGTWLFWVGTRLTQEYRQYRDAVMADPDMSWTDREKLIQDLRKPTKKGLRIFFPGYFALLIVLFIGSIWGWWL